MDANGDGERNEMGLRKGKFNAEVAEAQRRGDGEGIFTEDNKGNEGGRSWRWECGGIRNVDFTTPVFGPYAGVLQDDGELIELQRPDRPEQNANGNFSTPYITVDAVRYGNRTPWPAEAAGAGPSLERLNANAFGNDPQNWRASPGAASAGFNNTGNRPPIVSAGLDGAVVATIFPASVTLTPIVSDDGLPSGALSYAWTQQSGPGVVVFANAGAAATTAELPGVGTYGLRLTVSDGDFASSSDVAFAPLGAVTYLARGAVWKYLDDNSNQGTAWRATNFADAAWKQGPARLGIGGDGEATTIDGGPSGARYITTYFRRAFNVPSVAGLRDLTVRLLRDDGAVVYLNGQEVFRSNLPDGVTITSSTLATDVVGGVAEQTFFEQSISTTLLRAGMNYFAVEVHQVNTTSSDISFDLELVGSVSSENTAPIVNAGPDLAVTIPQALELQGSVIDDGLPNPPGAPANLWTKTSGPGEVTFANAASPRTTAQFSAPGTYVLQLTANDGAMTLSDDITVQVRADNAYGDWKATHFNAAELADENISGDDADADDDQFANLAEFLAGTDPRNGASYLGLGSVRSDTGLDLSFQALPGKAYELLARETVDSGAWTLIRSVEPEASPQVINVQAPVNIAEPTRFFQLSIPQQ
jgi:hypothetical protein